MKYLGQNPQDPFSNKSKVCNVTFLGMIFSNYKQKDTT